MQSAIAVPIQEVLADGNTYTFTKIGLDQWAGFCEWINIQEGRKRGHIVGIEEMMNGAISLQGARWLIWRSLQEHHNEIKLETVGKLFGSIDHLTKIIGEIMDMPDSQEGDKSDPPEEPTSP